MLPLPVCITYFMRILLSVLQAEHFEEESLNLVHTFNHSFTTDGIYECIVTGDNGISSFEESFTFTVQYALEKLHLVLWEPEFINYGVLRPSSFSKDMYFILQAEKSQPLATNASWEIDFGNGVTNANTAFISVSDKDEQYDTAERDHVYTWMFTFTEPGDWEFTVQLSNEISNLTLNFTYRVYEEIVDLVLEDIQFLVQLFTLFSCEKLSFYDKEIVYIDNKRDN